ncbi:D-alanyl-D-alanine carboxypeptidase dacC precursor [Cronobacter sakazakii]|nr:D-alanyl-D-alanine carboxypeptidase dacC precursor [Cronobacter sakazakii]
MALLGKALIHDVPDEYAIHKEKEFTFNKIRQPNRNRPVVEQQHERRRNENRHYSGRGL